jgi:hypothetical protein
MALQIPPITVLPKGQSSSDYMAGSIGKGLGAGIYSGFSALADMKLNEYANKQLMKAQNEQREAEYQRAEKALESMPAEFQQLKPLLRIPGGDKMMNYAIQSGMLGQSGQQGSWNPEAVQPGMAQTMGAYNQPQQQPYAEPEQYLGIGRGQQQMPSAASMLPMANMLQGTGQRAPEMGAEMHGQPGTAPQVPGQPMRPQETVAPSLTPKKPVSLADAIREGATNTPQMKQQRELQEKSIAAAAERAERKIEANKETADVKERRNKNAKIKADNKAYLAKEMIIHKSMAEQGAIAKEAMQLLKDHANEFPTNFASNLGKDVQSVTIRNPYVRKYLALINKYVGLLTTGMRGVPAKWKKELMENQKPFLGQPIETQMSLWKDAIRESGDDSKRLVYEASLGKNRHGNPRDIVNEMVLYDATKVNPLVSAQPFAVGTIIGADQSPDGQRHEVKMIDGKKRWEVI